MPVEASFAKKSAPLMFKHLSFLVFLLCFSLTSIAQETCKLRFVCATGSAKPLHCLLNNQPLRQQGFPSGYRSGLINFDAGSYHVQASHPDLGEINFKLNLDLADNFTIIFYAEVIPDVEEDIDDSPKKQLRHFILRANPEKAKARYLTILQLTPNETLEITLFNQPRMISRAQPFHDHTDSLFHAISYQGKLLCQFEMRKIQEYQLILFQADDGTLQAIHYGTR